MINIETRILLIRNDHDPITHYRYKWSDPIKNIAEKKGIKTDCVDGPKVTKSEVESRIKKLNPSFLILNGHGSDKSFYGHKGEIIFDSKDTACLKNKIVFSRACNCAKTLGKVAVNNSKCKAFAGYKFEFWNVRNTDTEIKPLNDQISQPIWEISNTTPISLIKGSTMDEAIEASHRKATKEISKLLFSEEPSAISVMRAIITNDEGLIYHGNGDTQI